MGNSRFETLWISSGVPSREEKTHSGSSFFPACIASNDPGNLTLDSMIEWTRAAGLKVGVVVYDDGDAKNELGPIPAEIFQRCWEICGKPSTQWQLEDASAGSFKMIAGEQSNIFFADTVAFADTVPAGVTLVQAKYSSKPSDEDVLDLAA